MNVFKIPSPNEIKISPKELGDILFKDRDPVFFDNHSSDSDDELSVVYLKKAAKDFQTDDSHSLIPNRIPGGLILEKIAVIPYTQDNKASDASPRQPEVEGSTHAKVNNDNNTGVITVCGPVGNDGSGHTNGDDDVFFSARVDDPVTLKWLSDNFERHENYSVPRGDMYLMFTQYCLEHGIRFICNQATFGKSVRAVFPDLKTKRIGIRGQSRYHYDGLRPKMNSNVSDKLIPRKNGNSKLQEDCRDYKCDFYQERKNIEFGPTYPSDHLIITLLPKFPTIGTIDVDSSRSEKMCLFLMLYRCYVVDILKTVIKTRFTQLEQITTSFWKNLSHDIINVLTYEDTLKVLRTCNSMMYNCMIRLLVPNVLVNIPTGMIGLLEKTFGPSFIQQHVSAISPCPVVIQNMCLEEVESFSKKLSERLKLNFLSGQARETLQCSETTKSIRNVIKRLDPKSVVDIACFPAPSVTYRVLFKRIENGIYEFQQLLVEKAKFTKYICWLRSLIQKVFNSASTKGCNQKNCARVVILELNMIVCIIAREINFHATESVQRAFHDIEAFFVSYVKFLMETEYITKDTDCS